MRIGSIRKAKERKKQQRTRIESLSPKLVGIKKIDHALQKHNPAQARSAYQELSSTIGEEKAAQLVREKGMYIPGLVHKTPIKGAVSAQQERQAKLTTKQVPLEIEARKTGAIERGKQIALQEQKETEEKRKQTQKRQQVMQEVNQVKIRTPAGKMTLQQIDIFSRQAREIARTKGDKAKVQYYENINKRVQLKKKREYENRMRRSAA